MSGMFGDNGAKAQAAEASRKARKSEQRSNEEAGREQQRGERGGVRGRGRDMLIGNLSAQLKSKLGG